MWPLSSPDLNPLDYGIWGILEARACATSHWNVEALKNSVNQEWSNLSSEKFIISTCSSFRSRVEKVVAAGGGHIEDLKCLTLVF